LPRITAGVEARDDDDPICRFTEMQSVRKSSQARRSDIPMCDRKLLTVFSYPPDLPIEFGEKSETQPLAARFIPIKCFINLKPR
jgi:hypothetical protein